MRTTLLISIAVVAIVVSGLSGATLLVPAHYETIQGAISVAGNGDTVLVSPGTYTENINFLGKAIVLASQYLVDGNPVTVRTTVIDGGSPANIDSGSVVVFVGGERAGSVLYGFTLRNGIGTAVPGSYHGGGIFIANGAMPVIEHNIIYSCNALIGGGVAAQSASPTISRNVIYANNSDKGGGLSLRDCQAQLEHNVIFGNTATTAGGGIYAEGSNVSISHDVIARDSSGNGGGINCLTSTWQISYCDFYGNLNGDFIGCSPAGFGDTSWGVNFNKDHVDVYHNLFREPKLADPQELDFSPQCDSRLVDAGGSPPETFPYGGKRADIGAYEILYYPGDLNTDKKINLVDATVYVNIIFRGTPTPCPAYIADLDCTRKINVSDLVALIAYWSGQGPVPCALTP
jgi:predicted outer membrane repeat protein